MAFNLVQSRMLSFGKELTLYHINPTCNDPEKKRPYKTLWKKEKMPVTRISVFKLTLFCRLQMLPIWTSLNLCHLVKS